MIFRAWRLHSYIPGSGHPSGIVVFHISVRQNVNAEFAEMIETPCVLDVKFRGLQLRLALYSALRNPRTSVFCILKTLRLAQLPIHIGNDIPWFVLALNKVGG